MKTYKVTNLSKSFKENQVIENLSISVDEGALFAVYGEARSGKTTLGLLLSGLLKPDSGSFYIDENEIPANKLKKYNQHDISFIPASPIFVENKTVYDNLLMAMHFLPGSKKEKKEQAKDVLKQMGLKNVGKKLPGTLSDLDLVRVSIARGLLRDPKIIILDDITIWMDSYGEEQIIDLVDYINNSGYTVLWITGSKRVVSRCDIAISIEGKKIKPRPQVITEEYEDLDLDNISDDEIDDGEYDDTVEEENVEYDEEFYEEEPVADYDIDEIENALFDDVFKSLDLELDEVIKTPEKPVKEKKEVSEEPAEEFEMPGIDLAGIFDEEENENQE